MNPQAQLNFCSFCCSCVMLQFVLKQKFFIKRPVSQELPYIKLLFKMYALYYTDVRKHQMPMSKQRQTAALRHIYVF